MVQVPHQAWKGAPGFAEEISGPQGSSVQSKPPPFTVGREVRNRTEEEATEKHPTNPGSGGSASGSDWGPAGQLLQARPAPSLESQGPAVL